MPNPDGDGDRPTLSAKARAGAWIRRRARIDARALAALRIALGLLLVADACLRWTDLEAHYTDAGLLPAQRLPELYPLAGALGLPSLGLGAWAFHLVLAGLVLAGVLLVLGVGSRWVALGALGLLALVQARNPLVLHAGDSLLRRLLFWAVFLPLGSRWSVDARRRGPGPAHVANAASLGLFTQVVVVYAANLLHKIETAGNWLDGTALAYVLHGDIYAALGGPRLAELPLEALAALNYLWLGLLATAPLLVLTTGRRRLALVAAFALGHLGMAATLRLGLFPAISLAGLIAFLPASLWDRLEGSAARPVPSPASSQALSPSASIRSTGSRTSAALTAASGARADAGEPDPSEPVGPTDPAGTDDPRAPPGSVGEEPVPTTSGPSRREDGVGSAAPEAGRASSARGRLAGPVQAGVAVLIVLLLVWNLAGLGFVDAPGMVTSMADPDDYGWRMFAAAPEADEWLVAPATLADGSRTDARHEGPTAWERPSRGHAYLDTRWRKYERSLEADDELLTAYADYLCTGALAGVDRPIVNLTIQRIRQPISIEGGPPGDLEVQTLLDHRCSSRGG